MRCVLYKHTTKAFVSQGLLSNHIHQAKCKGMNGTRRELSKVTQKIYLRAWNRINVCNVPVLVYLLDPYASPHRSKIGKRLVFFTVISVDVSLYQRHEVYRIPFAQQRQNNHYFFFQLNSENGLEFFSRIRIFLSLISILTSRVLVAQDVMIFVLPCKVVLFLL